MLTRDIHRGASNGVGRRDFLMAMGGTAVTLAALEAVPQILKAQAPTAQPAKPNMRPSEQPSKAPLAPTLRTLPSG